jgi:hypothetical protein
MPRLGHRHVKTVSMGNDLDKITYSSWLNQVEIWFAKIQRQVIARGIFPSVDDLRRKILRYIRHYNTTATPIKWIFSKKGEELRFTTSFPTATNRAKPWPCCITRQVTWGSPSPSIYSNYRSSPCGRTLIRRSRGMSPAWRRAPALPTTEPISAH